MEDRLATHYALHNVYINLVRGVDVLRQGEAIVGLNPCYPPNQVTLGDDYKRMGRYDEALMAYNRAIELDPSLKDSLQERIKVVRNPTE